LISTLLSASQTYLGYDKLQTQHTKLMIEYSKLLYTIENLIVEHKNNNSFVLSQDKINFILNSFEKLREEYILFPEKIWTSNKLIYKSKLNNNNLETSDSINIIISSLKNNKNFSFNDSHKQSDTNKNIEYDDTQKHSDTTKNIEIITYNNESKYDSEDNKENA
jgi:hypothetical protein